MTKPIIVKEGEIVKTTMLFMEGVADAVIRKLTGHRSEELERYKHGPKDAAPRSSSGRVS